MVYQILCARGKYRLYLIFFSPATGAVARGPSNTHITPPSTPLQVIIVTTGIHSLNEHYTVHRI